MKKEDIFEAIGLVDSELLEHSEVSRNKNSLGHFIKLGILAASLCFVLIGGYFTLKKLNTSSSRIDTGILVTTDGVTIPQIKINIPNNAEADMIAFFIYEGRVYVHYDFVNEGTNLVGNYLGTSTGQIAEWTPKEDYVDLSGSIGGDFYEVNGFDPNFILCMKYDDGSIETFINNNGITLKNGSDLFEDRLALSGNYSFVQFQTRNDWYYSIGSPTTLAEENLETVREFITAMNTAPFMRTEDIPLAPGENNIYDSKEIYHMFFQMNNGMTIHLRLFEGGYVCLKGTLDVCVQVNDEAFNKMVKILDELSK